MGFSSDMRVPLGSGASGQKQEEVGFAASPWGGTRYASQPKLHCGNLGRYFSVCPIKKPPGKGSGRIIWGLHLLSLLYIHGNGTGAKQSSRAGLVVLCMIYYHAPGAPFTAFHLNIYPWMHLDVTPRPFVAAG